MAMQKALCLFCAGGKDTVETQRESDLLSSVTVSAVVPTPAVRQMASVSSPSASQAPN
ncbi:hypothetical protein PAMP_011486 [Pampus punctatissimus]